MTLPDVSYLTTPIYYVNGPPHLGHAHTTAMADILRRARQLRGYRTFLSTGTDEHGQKNQEAADALGMETEAYLDLRASQFARLFDDLDVGYDYFARTSRPAHIEGVLAAELDLFDRGLLVKRLYSGLYCRGCEQFKRPSDLTPAGGCIDHGLMVEKMEEENYFFPLEPFRERLRRQILDNPGWIRPRSYANEILSFLESPLEDLCISRPKARVELGIPLPFDNEYVTYVWFDALLNYLTNIGWPNERYRDWWRNGEHLIGKDVLRTHAVYWPCMLMAIGVDLPAHITVHGHWVSPDGAKMSKSLGNVVDPNELIARYGNGAVRYYLARNMRAGGDSHVSNELIHLTYGAELSNKLGNLHMRCLKFCAGRFDGRVPAPGAEHDALLDALRDTVDEAGRDLMDLETLPRALAGLLEAVNQLNDFVTRTAPWTLIKTEGGGPTAGAIMYAALDGLRLVFEGLYPVMPAIARTALASLGSPEPAAGHRFVARLLDSGAALSVGEALFPRVEWSEEAEAAVAGVGAAAAPLGPVVETRVVR